MIWSFAINLVLLRLIVFYLDRFTQPSFLEPPQAAAATVLFLVVAHLVIYPWQIVGVLRACDRYLSDFGAMAWVWAVYLGLAVSMVVTLVSIFGALQGLFMERGGEPDAERWERERASKYTLSLTEGDTRVRLSGSLELGVTKKLEAFLRRYPNVTGLVLESKGGNIYEARGVAKLVQRYGLDTYVFESCTSACTTAFIGGSARVLGENGRLGFHRYGLAVGYPVPFVDIDSEQEKDRRFYRSQGIEGAFLARVFKASRSDLWFPSHDVLLAAGVVHRIEGSPR